MARKVPTGGGGAQRHTRGGHAGQRGSRRARHSRGIHRAHATPRQTQEGQTGPRAEHPAAGSVWAHTAGTAGTGGVLRPLLTLSPDQSEAAMTLTLVGAQQATLREALRAWGIAQDQAANRAWRRPGGLTRMAGL